jgi:hypothetical protein
LVGFLVSENARQVNGAAWTIDGCWTAVWLYSLEYYHYMKQFKQDHWGGLNRQWAPLTLISSIEQKFAVF